MQVILLERVAKLGQMGDVVKVRDGFARNYLLPQGKALRATKPNMERFETDRVQLEARNLERKTEAESVASKMDGHGLVVVRQAGETGQLYGSVSTRDLAEQLSEEGFSVSRSQVNLNTPIKTIGIHAVAIQLHPEVEVAVSVNVARSEDEAERQARGEDLTQRADGFEFEEDDEEDADEDARTDVFDEDAEASAETDQPEETAPEGDGSEEQTQ
ncbi:MAG: 50S ribosomal protein L9 [Pseudomonadota bacterium]